MRRDKTIKKEIKKPRKNQKTKKRKAQTIFLCSVKTQHESDDKKYLEDLREKHAEDKSEDETILRDNKIIP